MENQIGPEEEKYNAWEKVQRENHGLTSIRVSLPIKNIECNKEGKLEIEYENDFTREDFYKELNYINEAIATGKCKPYVDDVETFIEKEITNL